MKWIFQKLYEYGYVGTNGDPIVWEQLERSYKMKHRKRNDDFDRWTNLTCF